MTGADKKHLTAVAQLHDIGKIVVSSEILNKPGPLNDEEWELMRRHTIEGEQILATVPEIAEVADLVRACHERYDGEGYPDGLAGEDIPLVARIVFCADAFHAMRCDRPYREGRPVKEALAEMKANAGTQFDPVVVAALCDVHATLAIQRKHGLGILRSGARSRRLVALLATLTVSGSAMAATGAYKALPLVPDSDARDVPAVTQERTAAKSRAPPLSRAHPPSERAAKAATRARSKGSSAAATGPSAGSPRSGDKPDPRGVAHGVNGTAPGQSEEGHASRERCAEGREAQEVQGAQEVQAAEEGQGAEPGQWAEAEAAEGQAAQGEGEGGRGPEPAHGGGSEGEDPKLKTPKVKLPKL